MSMTLTGRPVKARSVNQTSTSFVAKIPTITEPNGDAATATGACVFNVGGDRASPSLSMQNFVKVKPYGVASNNQTFSVRVLGWSAVYPTGSSQAAPVLWVPELLAELLCTASSVYPGVAAAPVVATELFCDTLAITYGSTNVSVMVDSNGADAGIAVAVVDMKGNEKLELTFSTGSSATSCNALISYY
jgi:hypothetical protein